MKTHSLWKGPAKKMLRNGSLCGLLIEFLPDCTTIMDDPACLINHPKLEDDIIAALRVIHGAGVVHLDPLPRNMMVDSKGGMWWVDFGHSRTTSHYDIHPGHFAGEVMRVELMLRNDIIPAAREGRTPECEY
jgi:serine/threonine protein kinase